MTTEKSFSGRNRDLQDVSRRNVWKSLEHTDTGALITVKGTGTEDQKAIVLNTGHSFNLPDDTNTEVFLVAGASDLAQKYAILSIPRDKQRKWKTNTGGIQHPTNPDKAVELNEKRIWCTDKFAALAGVLEVIDGTVYIRGTLMANEVQAGNFVGPIPSGAMGPIPGWEE